MSKKGFAPIIIVLIIALLAAGGIAGYIFIKNRQPNKETTTTTTIDTSNITTTSVSTTSTTKNLHTAVSKNDFSVVYKNGEFAVHFLIQNTTKELIDSKNAKIVDCSNTPDFLSTCDSKTVAPIIEKANIEYPHIATYFFNTSVNSIGSKIVIDGIPFCEWGYGETAAGTSYSESTYITKMENKCLVVDIVTRHSNVSE